LPAPLADEERACAAAERRPLKLLPLLKHNNDAIPCSLQEIQYNRLQV
jgi:hypothetical protein